MAKSTGENSRSALPLASSSLLQRLECYNTQVDMQGPEVSSKKVETAATFSNDPGVTNLDRDFTAA